MKYPKITTLLVIATLPFFTSCASWNTATISVGLKNKDLTYAEAEDALKNGANVKESWAGKCLLEEAAEQNRRDLIELFVEKGGVSCFEADAGHKNKPFSLFLYAFNTRNEGLMLYCLEHLDKSQADVKTQLMDVAKGTFDSLISGEVWFASAQVLEKIRQSGLLTDEESKHFSPESIRLAKSRKFLGLCESGSLDIYLHRHGDGIFKGIDVNAKDSEGNSGLVLFLKNSNPDKREKVSLGGGCIEIASSEKLDLVGNCGSPFVRATSAQIDALKNERVTIFEGGAVSGNALASLQTDTDLENYAVICDEPNGGLSVRVEKKRIWEDVIKAFITAGADVNAKDIEGRSVLYLCFTHENCDGDIMKILRNAGARFTAEEATALLSKIVEEKSDSIAGLTWNELIFQGADVNTRIRGCSLLYVAKLNDFEFCSALEDAGAELLPEEREVLQKRLNAYLVNAVKSGNVDLIKRYVKNGADVNTKVDGHSLLYIAKSNDSEFCSVLEDAGAELLPEEREVLQKRLNTDLINAVKSGNVDLIKRYVKNGANVNTKVDGHSLLYVAKSNDSRFCSILENAGAKLLPEEDKLLKSIKLRELCYYRDWHAIVAGVKNGDFNLQSEINGKNAFHWVAASYKCEEIDESFLVALKKLNVDVNKKSPDGRTPLAVAIENTNPKVVKILLKLGANPNDSIPIKGLFGEAGSKKLMSLSIDIYNERVDIYHRSVPSSRDTRLEDVRFAKEIVSLMSQATGSEVTDL